MKKVKLSEIKSFFSNYNFSKETITLDSCSKILNLEKFIKSHVKYLESNNGNARFTPYYNRLLKIYLKLKNNG